MVHLVDAACEAHSLRRCNEALELLQAAQEEWEAWEGGYGKDDVSSDDAVSGGEESGGHRTDDYVSGDDGSSSGATMTDSEGASSASEGVDHGAGIGKVTNGRHQKRRHARERQRQDEQYKRYQQQQLGPAMSLFFGCAACGVLLTAGRVDDAWEALSAAAPALEWLNEAGADAAAWHGSAGVVLFHLGDLQVRG